MVDGVIEDDIKNFFEYWDRRKITLPNPDIYPLQFAYYVKLWRFYECNRTD